MCVCLFSFLSYKVLQGIGNKGQQSTISASNAATEIMCHIWSNPRYAVGSQNNFIISWLSQIHFRLDSGGSDVHCWFFLRNLLLLTCWTTILHCCSSTTTAFRLFIEYVQKTQFSNSILFTESKTIFLLQKYLSYAWNLEIKLFGGTILKGVRNCVYYW